MANQFQKQAPSNYVPINATQPAAPVARTRGVSEPNLDFISSDNRDNEYQKAVKHSRKVKFWKIAFPVMGVMVILGLAGSLVLNSLNTTEVAVDSINVSDGNLVMENPQLSGFDKKKRPYNLRAAQAIQNVENPNQVELRNITAELPMDETITATINAGNGIYNADEKTLILKETINLVTSNGMVVNLQNADVDIGNSTMRTSNPISATSPQADISSNSMTVEDGGNKMIFEGKVRMTLRPDELRKTSETNE